jgi:putative membrane protein
LSRHQSGLSVLGNRNQQGPRSALKVQDSTDRAELWSHRFPGGRFGALAYRRAAHCESLSTETPEKGALDEVIASGKIQHDGSAEEFPAPTDTTAPAIDYRFSLANERTYLAWIRTSFALLAGGIAAAKALGFHHEFWRWTVAAPPILIAIALMIEATQRWYAYEEAMRHDRRLPVGRWLKPLTVILVAYAVLALLAVAFDQ